MIVVGSAVEVKFNNCEYVCRCFEKEVMRTYPPLIG